MEEPSRLMELLERGVNAVEHLANDPVIEIEAGPPVCPACGVFNPEIVIREKEGRGKIFEFVLEARCLSCGQKFYGIPETWRMFSTRSEVENEINERKGGNVKQRS
jgi:hypothetical protein